MPNSGDPADKIYDVAIIGGGLAGLALSIKLARAGHCIILFEKEQYPFHKVCGEYISMESWDYLHELGVQPGEMGASRIDRLLVTGTNGIAIKRPLTPGGFGISRYLLDDALARSARHAGVKLMELTKVSDISKDGDKFRIHTSKVYKARMVCCSYGKRSNMDVKWQRDFISSGKKALNNYIGIKYHVKGNFPENEIALHNFKQGYCGLVKIEADKYCLCYLTTASNLKQCGNSIEAMERNVLSQNPYLESILSNAVKLNEGPITISQISFDKKSPVENHCIMLGDAAGMITPLCGNGMSMALHASKMATGCMSNFLSGSIDQHEMEQSYLLQWHQHFYKRLKTGRMLQSLLGKSGVTNSFLQIVKPFPGLIDRLVTKTHGDHF